VRLVRRRALAPSTTASRWGWGARRGSRKRPRSFSPPWPFQLVCPWPRWSPIGANRLRYL
jgi:hypothetical protein